MRFLQPLSLLAIPGLDFPLKPPPRDYSMLISPLSAHSARALPFLISVVTFLIHSHLTSNMHKFSRTCKTSMITILIRVKVGLEFTVLFSLSRYIFLSIFLFFPVSIIFIYIYLCCDDFPLYVTCKLSISVFYIITLITAKYSVILQKNPPSSIIPFSLCLYLAQLFLPPTMKKKKRYPHHLSRTFSFVSRSFLFPLIHMRHIFW